MMCTNDSDASEYNLYFIISRSIKNRDDIYGKFGTSKNINYEKRFITYDTNNPSYLHVSVPYDKTIMHKLGTQHEYLDNYINNKVLLKMSSVPKVHFKPSSKKTDWFFVTKETAYNIMLFMVQFNEYRHSHPIDSVKDCIYFVKKIRVLLQGDIEYATKCINDNNTTEFDNSSTYLHLYTLFMHKFYKNDGMVPIKNVRRNPEWNKEYETYITTKDIHVCKSCKSRAYKGCCSEYSSNNRSKIRMIVGWSE